MLHVATNISKETASEQRNICSSLPIFNAMVYVQNAGACLIHQHEKVRAHHPRPAAATLASSPPPCAIQDRRAGVQGATRPPASVPGGRIANLCLSLDADDCVRRTSTCA